MIIKIPGESSAAADDSPGFLFYYLFYTDHFPFIINSFQNDTHLFCKIIVVKNDGHFTVGSISKNIGQP